MAFRASLELNNKEFDVLYSNYEFSRNTDPKGMPSSSVLGGRVKATIESTEDTSVIEAMLNSPFKPVEGKIIYKKNGGRCQDEGDPVQERIHRSLLGNSGREQRCAYDNHHYVLR